MRAMPEARAGPWKISAGHDQAGPETLQVHAPAIHSTAKPATGPRCWVAIGVQLQCMTSEVLVHLMKHCSGDCLHVVSGAAMECAKELAASFTSHAPTDRMRMESTVHHMSIGSSTWYSAVILGLCTCSMQGSHGALKEVGPHMKATPEQTRGMARWRFLSR